MALFVSQKDDRSELQRQIAAELQRKAKDSSQQVDIPDGVNDSRYMKDKKTTTSLAWAWLIIVIFTVALVIWLTVVSMTR